MTLPPLDDILGSLRVVALPLAVRFRGVNVREAALFEGPEGWTEFSPFVEYDDDEAATWLAGAIDYGWRSLPKALRNQVPVNATVPAVSAEQVPQVLARFDGCRTAKVKVAEAGQTLADDVARVRAVRDVMGPDGRIRIDANAAWNVDEAERAIHALAEFDLEYVEQPCATVEELKDIRKRVKYAGIPIAADESVRKAADPLAVARAGAADLIIVKAQPLGGVHRALDIVAETGLGAVVSSALDTAIGLRMGAALAAALPTLDYDCGLGTASLFRADIGDSRPQGGMISAARITPDAAALAAYAADGETAARWHARIERCYRVLEAAGTSAVDMTKTPEG